MDNSTEREKEERNRCMSIKEEFITNIAMLPEFEIHEIVWFLANKYDLTLAEIETIVDNQ